MKAVKRFLRRSGSSSSSTDSGSAPSDGKATPKDKAAAGSSLMAAGGGSGGGSAASSAASESRPKASSFSALEGELGDGESKPGMRRFLSRLGGSQRDVLSRVSAVFEEDADSDFLVPEAAEEEEGPVIEEVAADALLPQHAMEEGELCLLHGIVSRRVEGKLKKQRTLALGERNWCRLELHSRQLVWRRPLADIHSVERIADTSAFRVYAYGDKIGSRLHSSLDMRHGSDAATQLSVYEFVCSSMLERDTFVLLFNRVLRDLWQAEFEENCIAPTGGPLVEAPEIYQMHLFVTKKNRLGRFQIRGLVLSTAWLYNCEFVRSPVTAFKTCKWALPYAALDKLETFALSPTVLVIHVNLDELESCMDDAHRIYLKDRPKTSYKFIVKDEAERTTLVTELTYHYARLRDHELPVEVNDTKEVSVHRSGKVKRQMKAT